MPNYPGDRIILFPSHLDNGTVFSTSKGDHKIVTSWPQVLSDGTTIVNNVTTISWDAPNGQARCVYNVWRQDSDDKTKFVCTTTGDLGVLIMSYYQDEE